MVSSLGSSPAFLFMKQKTRQVNAFMQAGNYFQNYINELSEKSYHTDTSL